MFFQNVITLILRGPLHVLSGRHWIGCLSTPLLLHLLLSHLVWFSMIMMIIMMVVMMVVMMIMIISGTTEEHFG